MLGITWKRLFYESEGRMHFSHPTHPQTWILYITRLQCVLFISLFIVFESRKKKKGKKERYIIQLKNGINVFQEAKLIVSLHSLQLCISPLLRDVNETRCTLDFGQRALKISSTAYVNINVSETAFLLLYLHMETALNFLVTTLFR